jgi:hypothetical protein
MAVTGFAVVPVFHRPGSVPLPPATVASYVAAAQVLAHRYVDDAWCAPLLSGALGTVPQWPGAIATRRAAPALTKGPTPGHVPATPGTATLDVSDARAVLPPRDRPWTVRPRFCVAQLAYPRLVTSAGTTRPRYPALAHRLRSIEEIFRRFPKYLGQVVRVAVPTTVEVSYQLSVGDGPPQAFHLWWITTLGLVPTGRAATTLRLATWDVGGRGAWVTVRRDAPPGPEFVHPAPPGSGP